MVDYIIRAIVSFEDKWWTIEMPAGSPVLPEISHKVSLMTGADEHELFDVESVIHYPGRDLGPVVIIKKSCDKIDESILVVEAIRKMYDKVSIKGNAEKPNWYKVYKLLDEIGYNEHTFYETVRAILTTCNHEKAQDNNYFDKEVNVLKQIVEFTELEPPVLYLRWGEKIGLEKLHIAPSLIQSMILTSCAFLEHVGIEKSLWPDSLSDAGKGNKALD